MMYWPEKGTAQLEQRAQQGTPVVQGTVIAQTETGRSARWDETPVPTDTNKGTQGKGSQYEQDRIQQLEGMLTTLFSSHQRRIEWSNAKLETQETGKSTRGKATQTMGTWKGQIKGKSTAAQTDWEKEGKSSKKPWIPPQLATREEEDNPSTA